MSSDRNREMVHLYRNAGLTLAQIGERYGVTRERVRQILADKDILDRHYGAQKRAEREVLTRDAFARISEGVSTRKAEAERLGLSEEGLYRRFLRLGLRVPRKLTATHGDRSYYTHYGCRCDDCRKAQRAYMASLKEREPPTHGTDSAYQNYGCRCEPCRRAAARKRSQ